MTAPDIKPDDKVLLIVEDNLTFAKIMLEKAHENGIKAIVATKWRRCIDFINQFNPDAITMDIKMPDTSGWKSLIGLKMILTSGIFRFILFPGERE